MLELMKNKRLLVFVFAVKVPITNFFSNLSIGFYRPSKCFGLFYKVNKITLHCQSIGA